MQTLVNRALNAKRESKYIEFKEAFNPHSRGEWCELLKDIVAMINSGGGAIVFGVTNKGDPCGFDVSCILEIDNAVLTDKINKYTGQNYSDIEIVEREKNSNVLAIFLITKSAYPLVFIKPGTYDIGDNKQKTAFSQGTVYFKHGAKSEPATADDLREFVDRQMESIRKQWLDGVQKVVKSKQGSIIQIVSSEVQTTEDSNVPTFRIVDDPNAPAMRNINTNSTHIYRQLDVINYVKSNVHEDIVINSYDMQAIRIVYNIDDNIEFCYRPNFGAPQFSHAFMEWLVKKYNENTDFFNETRKSYQDRNVT